MNTSNHVNSSLNVQIFVYPDQVLASLAQILYLFKNRHFHLATPGYPVVEMPQKPDLTTDQRKEIVSQFLLLVKENTLSVQLKWGLVISRAKFST
jgi:hypothetical protein